MTKHEIKKYSWNEISKLVYKLSLLINEDNYKPDLIVGITRGGCIPAVCLSHLLKVREFTTIEIQSTVSDNVRSNRNLSLRSNTIYSEIVKERNVLIVDDVTNSGETNRAAVDHFKLFNPRTIKTAAIVWDKYAGENLSSFDTTMVDYYADEIDSWASFPWEV